MKKQNPVSKSRAESILENFVRYRIVSLKYKDSVAVVETNELEFSLYHEAEAHAMLLQKRTGFDYAIARQETAGILLYIEKEA